MIPMKINNLYLCQIFEPGLNIDGWTEEQIDTYCRRKLMYPAEVRLTSETYSRDADRTADYELQHITIVNRKAKPEFVWDHIRAEYVEKLLSYLSYDYNFKDVNDIVQPKKAKEIYVTYQDFVGTRTILDISGEYIAIVSLQISKDATFF